MMTSVDGQRPEPELLLIDVATTEQPPLSRWWILAVLVVGAAAGAAIVTSGIERAAPTIEISSTSRCTWSGAEVAAGMVDIEFVNESRRAVWVKFSPMVEGTTIDDVLAAAPVVGDLHDYERLPMFIDRGQHTRGVEPGSAVRFKVALTRPVDYAVSCSTTEPTFVDGVPVVAADVLRVVPTG